MYIPNKTKVVPISFLSGAWGAGAGGAGGCICLAPFGAAYHTYLGFRYTGPGLATGTHMDIGTQPAHDISVTFVTQRHSEYSPVVCQHSETRRGVPDAPEVYMPFL